METAEKQLEITLIHSIRTGIYLGCPEETPSDGQPDIFLSPATASTEEQPNN